VIARLAHERVEVTEKEVRAYLLKIKPELSENEPELEIHLRRPDIWKGARIQQIEKRLAKTWVDGPGSIAGFIVALVGVCVLGALLASYVGRSLWRTVEKFIMNTPFLRKVFPYVKQVTDFFLTNEDQRNLFSRVVAVEYPRKGVWSLGFVTGSGLQEVVNTVRREFLTVIIPTSPTPFTGFVITVPKKQTIDLDMTIEEAFRFIVSGGVITPGSEHTAAALSKPDSHKGG
ncbi:MAG TPA: DUF502 domain-containing protein, partial [Sedimentisphaerales bacterium]|nr:DUF502 domain-containing protein [Sedimentisphaerales bacterium]